MIHYLHGTISLLAVRTKHEHPATWRLESPKINGKPRGDSEIASCATVEADSTGYDNAFILQRDFPAYSEHLCAVTLTSALFAYAQTKKTRCKFQVYVRC